MIKHSAADERPLTPAELTDMNGALLITGYDTTASMITLGLACMLLERPGRWEKLCADPLIWRAGGRGSGALPEYRLRARPAGY